MTGKNTFRNAIVGVVFIAVLIAASFWVANSGITGYAVAQSQAPAGAVQPQLEKVKVGYQQVSYYLPAFVAKEKGFFEEQGLDVEMVQFKGTNQVVDAAIQGKIDYGAGGYSTVFAAEAASPGQLKVFGRAVETEAGEKYQNFLLVPKNSSVQDIMDLKDGIIGTYTGTTQLLWLRLMLPKVGLDPEKDVQIMQVAPELQVNALAAGQFEALFTIEPYATIAVEKGVARVLIGNMRGKYIWDPFPAGPVGFFSAKYLKENPAKAEKIKAAVEKAVDYINAHESEAKALLPKYTPLDASIAAKVKLYKFDNDDSVYRDYVQKLADLLYEGKEIKKRIDTSALFLKEEDLK